jgi:hypothetical protein
VHKWFWGGSSPSSRLGYRDQQELQVYRQNLPLRAASSAGYRSCRSPPTMRKFNHDLRLSALEYVVRRGHWYLALGYHLKTGHSKPWLVSAPATGMLSKG